MKKFMLFALSLVPVLVFAQGGEFVLKGKLSNLSAPLKISMTWQSDQNKVSDSAVLKNGAFELKGKVTHPVKAHLFLQSALSGKLIDMLSLFLDKGTITIRGSDSLSTASVSGPSATSDYQSLQERLKGVAYKQRWPVYMQFIKDNPASFVSLDALYHGGLTPKLDEVEPLFNLLSPEIRNSENGKYYAHVAGIGSRQKGLIGQIAPLFVQKDPEGSLVRLEDFRGKYVLLDFWMTTCVPCRKGHPDLVKAYGKYKDKNFTILSVSADSDKDRAEWLKAIETDKLTWTQVSDRRNGPEGQYVGEQYGVTAIPRNFLIDPHGKIIAKDLKGEALDRKLAEVLAVSNQ